VRQGQHKRSLGKMFDALRPWIFAAIAMAGSLALFGKFYWFEPNLYGDTIWPRMLKGYLGRDELTFYLGVPMVGASLIAWQAFEITKVKLPFWPITVGTRNGLPCVSWTQEAGSFHSEGRRVVRGLNWFWLGLTVFVSFMAFVSGTPEHAYENAIAGAIVGALLGAYGVGEALKQRRQNGLEQIEDSTPGKRREDCEAYLESINGQIWFTIRRGDASKAALPVVEFVPWTSIGNFEEGSHKQWFRSRGSVGSLADWGVIVTQSSEGPVVRVAESVSDHAWLVKLLVILQNTFIAPREAILQDLRDKDEPSSKPDSDPGSRPGDVPLKPF